MNRKFLLTFVFIALILPFVSCTHMAPPDQLISRTDGLEDWGKAPPGPNDLARHRIDGEKPFEWWYFDGHLDNGQVFVGVFQVPSFVSGDIEAMFTLYTEDWVRKDYFIKLNPEEIRVSYDDVHIETPAGFVRRLDDNTYHVKWAIDDMEAEFTLTTLAQGWMPGKTRGQVNLPENEFFWAVHQGQNRIDGTLTRNGVTQHVTGIGYADHNWGKKPLNEITRKWTWGRIIAGDYTIIYAAVDYHDPALVLNPLYIAKGDRLIVGSGSPTIRQWDYETHPGLGRHFPRQVEIEYDGDGIQAKLHVRKKRLVEDVDLIKYAGYDGISRWLIRTFFARPTYFRIIAEFDGSIRVDGEEDAIAGECLYEVMGFE